MTALRGGAPSSDDDRSAEGTGPRPYGNTASDGPPYDMGARWHRYKWTAPTAPASAPWWAAVSERLLYAAKLDRRTRRTALAVDVWCALYIGLFQANQSPWGYVDPCEVAAALGVSDRTVRRGLATLQEIGAITERRRVGNGNLIVVRLDVDRFGVTRGRKP